ncbi:MAG: hypothetical protein VW378_00675 [bacterium]
MKRIYLNICLLILCLNTLTLSKEKKDTYKPQKITLEPITHIYKHTNKLLLDDFDNKSFKKNWKTFGDLKSNIIINNKNKYKWLSKNALHLYGKKRKFFIGGIANFLKTDASTYKTLKISLINKSKKPFQLKIELYDDDNNNHVIELNKTLPYLPSHDDKFVYDQTISKKGLNILYIPLNLFIDMNPMVGDNKWNPNHKNKSGGLIQAQFIFIQEEEHAEIDIEIDNIKLLKK